MGKRVYASGLMPSDVALTREPRGRRGQSPTQLRQTVMGPELDDAARSKAAANVRRLCPDDAEEMLDALGLAVKPQTPDPTCPVCGSIPGASCKSERGRALGNWHAARKRLAARTDNIIESEHADG